MRIIQQRFIATRALMQTTRYNTNFSLLHKEKIAYLRTPVVLNGFPGEDEGSTCQLKWMLIIEVVTWIFCYNVGVFANKKGNQLSYTLTPSLIYTGNHRYTLLMSQFHSKFVNKTAHMPHNSVFDVYRLHRNKYVLYYKFNWKT